MRSEDTDVDVCILGAGPHGLAAAAHLRMADPQLRLAVIDPSGQWLEAWRQQFARAGIETLRSPVVHHVAPDPFALSRFIDDHAMVRSGLPYDLPTADAFATFCDAVVEALDLDSPIATMPHDIRSTGGHLAIDCGSHTLTANHLVVATNPHQRPIPDWVWPLLGHHPGLVTHALDVDLAQMPSLDGECITIVGGGMTAAHLAVGAVARGASVHLVSRENLRIRSFDTAPGWLGPKYLDAFHNELDPRNRLLMAQRARAGGSIPAWMHARLTALADTGVLHFHESAVVRNATVLADGGCVVELSTQPEVATDRLWLATGTRADAGALRCIRPLLADVVHHNGFPLVDVDLRLGPHRAFVMGRIAMAGLGPAAGNLWGAQRAAHRIAHAITGVDLACDTVAPN